MDIEQLKKFLNIIDREADPERYDSIEYQIRAEIALQKLPWEKIKKIKNANGYSLYPLDWQKVERNYLEENNNQVELEQEEFEEKLKELCDLLYGWGLYEKCPACSIGKKIPVWKNPHQYTPFCGCSNYPFCSYAVDRAGEFITI